MIDPERGAYVVLPLAPEPWRAEAACSGKAVERGDHELFFAERGSTRAAEDFCADCPVAWDCLAYSVEWQCGAGTWGGLTARRRRDFMALHAWRLDANTKRDHEFHLNRLRSRREERARREGRR